MSTSSFVSEVLANAGRLEKEDLNAKLGALSKKTNELKAEVYDSLQKKYEDFYPNLMSAVDLNNRVKNLSTEMQSVATKVEKDIQAQLTLSATEFQDLSSQLSESNAIIHVLERLVKIENALQAFESSVESKNYEKAAAQLAEVHSVLTSGAGPRDGEIRILQALHDKYHIQREKLLSDVAKAWVDTVKWDISKDDGEKGKQDTQLRVSLCIRHTQKQNDVIRDVVQAMQDLDILSKKINNFGDRFLKSVLDPILSCNNLQIKLDDSEESSILSLSGKRPEKCEVVSPLQALGVLDKVFVFLFDHLFNIEVRMTQNGPDGDGTSSTPLMRILGSFIDKAATDMIITKSLSHSIPTDHRDLEAYTEVMRRTEGFQGMLIEQTFLEPNNTALADYVNDVNVLFANKKCHEILEKARSLMTSEIHNMVKITPICTEELPSMGLEGTSAKRTKSESTPFQADVMLSTSTFQLPTCYISESVKLLMDLAYSTLVEATQEETTHQCSIQLFYSVRNMLMLYCEVIPTYHRDSLENLPQITALHHNNCMYIAHHLLTLGHQFRPQLPAPLSQGAATFIDLVPKLRRLGTEAFLHQMAKQRDLLLDCLAQAHGFVSVSETDNNNRSERAIKQLIHQIRRLCNVWSPVLPASVYYKSIGTLANTAVVEIITKVTSLEDISADDAGQLHSLMSIITDNAPSFYNTETNDTKPPNTKLLLHSNIRKWNKFTELMWVLNAGLQDIADRWADGKGPLAAEFQANEMKQLIRALFQNTDKRSKVLATIK